MCTMIYYDHVGQRRSVDIQNKLQAVEIFNETERYREERALLLTEMNNVLKFYHEMILPCISQSISGMNIVNIRGCMHTELCTYMHMYIKTTTYAIISVQ